MINNHPPEKDLYYTTSDELATGAIIPVGMIERSKQAVQNQGGWGRQAIEDNLEKIRFDHYPDKPSRFNACFVFESLLMVESFIKRRCQDDPANLYNKYVYKVRINDLSKPWHRGHFALCATVPEAMGYADYSSYLYWASDLFSLIFNNQPFNYSEIVTESDLTVLQKAIVKTAGNLEIQAFTELPIPRSLG